MFESIKSWFYRKFSYPVAIPAPASEFPEPIPGQPELPNANSRGKVKLAVIVGHEEKAQGATMSGKYAHISEYMYNMGVAARMKEIAHKDFPQVEVEIILRNGIGVSGAYLLARQRHCDVAIELHFNSFNGKVTGTETLCSPASDDVDFAHLVQRYMCKAFKREGTSRGVKTLSKSDRGAASVYAFPGGANCLVEPFFGDHEVEAEFAWVSQYEYAYSLVQAVEYWAKSVDLIR